MSQDILLQAEKREGLGKSAAARLRLDGKVPAVIQENGKESVSIVVDGPALLKAYRSVGRSQAIDLTIGKAKKLALIKEVEFVPMKPELQHVVFQALKADEVVDAEVPIHIVGDILPESLEVSGASLVEIDDRLTIGDIKMPEGVELVELLATVDDEEKREEFLSQPIALVKDPEVVEVDEGVELAEGESEADAVASENGGDTDNEKSE